jgi:hypothetical protein
MLVTFKDIKILFVIYFINALPTDSLSLRNKTNIVAHFFLTMLRLLNVQPRILNAAYKISTENVRRKLGRTRHKLQVGANLFSE